MSNLLNQYINYVIWIDKTLLSFVLKYPSVIVATMAAICPAVYISIIESIYWNKINRQENFWFDEDGFIGSETWNAIVNESQDKT